MLTCLKLLLIQHVRMLFFLQCDQLGYTLRYAQLQDAPQGQREGGSGLQNTQRRPTTPGEDLSVRWEGAVFLTTLSLEIQQYLY